MLVWSGSETEPRVVGEVQHPVGSGGAGEPVADLGRKDRLVADERHRRRQPGNVEYTRTRPGREASGDLDEIRDAGFLQNAFEWHIFAKGDEVLLVVSHGLQPVPVQYLDRVEIAGFAAAANFGARGAGDQRGARFEKAGDAA